MSLLFEGASSAFGKESFPQKKKQQRKFFWNVPPPALPSNIKQVCVQVSGIGRNYCQTVDWLSRAWLSRAVVTAKSVNNAHPEKKNTMHLENVRQLQALDILPNTTLNVVCKPCVKTTTQQ